MFEVQDLIDRAKTYVDDEHRAEDAWISPERWLTFFNVERRKLYKQWIRAGLVIPTPTLGYLAGETTQLTGVLAVIGVRKDLGGSTSEVRNASANEGRHPFWRSATQPSTPGSRWAAFGTGTTVTIELDGVSDLTYTAPVAAAQAVFDFDTYELLEGTPAQAVFDGELTVTEAGVDGNDIAIRFVPDAVGDPSWTNSGTNYTYHFDFSVHTTEDFEASITGLPFTLTRASTVNVAWTDWSGIQSSFLGSYFQFEDGADAVEEDGNYLVRYIPRLADVTDPTTEVDLPDGGDERLVLGMARRSLIKESGASRRIDQEILDSDAELNLAAHAAMGGIKMRRVPKYTELVPVTPNRWIYFG
jgi:hypothetical protein